VYSLCDINIVRGVVSEETPTNREALPANDRATMADKLARSKKQELHVDCLESAVQRAPGIYEKDDRNAPRKSASIPAVAPEERAPLRRAACPARFDLLRTHIG